mgnify:CR=1 FL=1
MTADQILAEIREANLSYLMLAQSLIRTRCQRGAEIARQMRFSEEVAQGILDLDEHFDGGGQPDKVCARRSKDWGNLSPLRPRAFGGKGADGMKKEIPTSRWRPSCYRAKAPPKHRS